MPPESEPVTREDQRFRKLQGQYRNLVEKSSILSEKDKKSMLDFLFTEEDKNPDTLQKMVEHFPQAEKSVEKQVADYGKQIREAIEQGLFAKKSAKSYEEWFKELSYEERAAYLKGEKKTDLHDPKRKEVLRKYKHLPHAVRDELKEKFFNADFQEREKIVDEATKKHEELKAAFLKLPKEVQEKYHRQFKEMGLKERETFLKSLKETKSAGDEKSPENARLCNMFDIKMHKKIEENLFSPLSEPAWEKWFVALSIADKRRMLQRSDLDNPQRVQIRDAFYAVPPEMRKPHELKFRNADLDSRKAILAQLQQPSAEQGSQEYPENIVRHTLEQEMRSQSMHHKCLLYTFAKQTGDLRKKAELRYKAKQTGDIAQRAQERGNEVDETGVFYLNDLQHHAEQRHGLKRWLIRKKAQGLNAVATNMTLLNRRKEKVGADQFKELVVAHLRNEAITSMITAASGKLPRADKTQLRRVAEKLDLTVDLYRTVA